MITATPSEQQRLLELQEVDTQLRQQQHRRSHLPEQQALDEHEQMLEAVSSEYATRRDEMTKLQLTQKRLENEVATLESRRKSEEGRMYSGAISSEKELEAVHDTLTHVLETAIDTRMKADNFPSRFLLPRRDEGEECPRCGGEIRRIEVSGRGSYFCPECQGEEP